MALKSLLFFCFDILNLKLGLVAKSAGRGYQVFRINRGGGNLVPRVFSLFKMAAAREKTLAHSRSRVSNEDGDVFKMAATAKRVRRTGYEMLR